VNVAANILGHGRSRPTQYYSAPSHKATILRPANPAQFSGKKILQRFAAERRFLQ